MNGLCIDIGCEYPWEGPRSLGTRKSFHQPPSSDLPPTIYVKQKRGFSPSPADLNQVNDAGTFGSPNVDSPSISSTPTFDDSSTLTPTIAISVAFGLIVIGLAGWAGFHYRKKLLKGGEQKFDASNVCERGLKPRSDSLTSFSPTGATLLPYDRGRRVSFIDEPEKKDDSAPSSEGNEFEFRVTITGPEENTTYQPESILVSRPSSTLISRISLPVIEEEEPAPDDHPPRPESRISYHNAPPPTVIDSPPKRARSHSVSVSVKQVNIVRTAVGRSMSLPASKIAQMISDDEKSFPFINSVRRTIVQPTRRDSLDSMTSSSSVTSGISHGSEDWNYQLDTKIYEENAFELDSEELYENFPLPSAHLPHIRITSH